MIIRELLEERENSLHSKATKSINSIRLRPESKSPIRTEFQRDRDRILHAKSFRRLKHKTQVFIAPEGDHYRTRLTHTLEVSQIARTIARALNLNEDLTEAISLGHDLGHTPFGHIGEKVLDKLVPNGFKHNLQSLRVVDKLEYEGKGLNLTDPVRNGILKHSKGMGPIIPSDLSLLPATLEGQIVRLADIIAYVNHDLDDAFRAKIIKTEDIPSSVAKRLGSTFAARIDTIVNDVIEQSLGVDLSYIAISESIYDEISKLRDFLYTQVYWRKDAEADRQRIGHILMFLYERMKFEPEVYIHPYPLEDSVDIRIIDFIAGMTDNYALNWYQKICPKE